MGRSELHTGPKLQFSSYAHAIKQIGFGSWGLRACPKDPFRYCL